ncbi:MAG: hypothetical protein IJW53_04075 [Clostridia bacterium]|nr:hypothetical protein [Clostridia bacterium]
MKRIALLLVMVILLSMALSSCEVVWLVVAPKDAEELWERIDETMNDLKSYRSEAVAAISFEYSGYEVDGEMEMTVVAISSENDNDSYFYDRSTMNIDMDGTTVTADELTAYEDGKMYLCRNTDDRYSRIFSKLSFDGFLDYYFDSDVNFDISPEGAKDTTLRRFDVLKWELSYSSFEEDRLEEILEQVDFDEFVDEMELEISDISVDLKTDERYRVSEMTVNFIDENYDAPVISISVNYSDFDSAERVEFSKQEYTEVDDARVAKWVSDYLDDVIDNESVKFLLYIEQSVTVYASNNQTSTSRSIERDEIVFANNNGGFTYGIDAEIDDQDISIEYKNGSQVVRVGDKKQTYVQQENYARSFIKELMNPSEFSIYDVRDIWKIGANTYRIYLNIHDNSQYKELAKAMKVGYQSSEVYLEVVMDGEDVKTITTYITVKGRNNYVTSSNPILDGTYTLKTVMTVVYD